MQQKALFQHQSSTQLSSSNAPVQIIAGSDDLLAPIDPHANWYQKHIKQAELVVMETG